MKDILEILILLEKLILALLLFGKRLPHEIVTKVYRYIIELFPNLGSDYEEVFESGVKLPPGLKECPNGDSEKAQVFVGFATNRELKGSEITNEIAGITTYGYCEVSIPKYHLPGKLEVPKQRWYWFDETEVQSMHFVLKQCSFVDAKQFFKHISLSSPGDVLLYVHGFNVSFEDAALRAAQLGYDLRFSGQTMFFSWASHNSGAGYINDSERISNSINDIRNFLEQLAVNDGVNSIFMLAHSMGSRGLAEAVSTIKSNLSSSARSKFKELILAEPDISQDIFQSKIASGLSDLGARVTIYASKNDKALGISQKVNHGVCRLGQAGAQIYVDPCFDTVDASDVGISILSLNHSSYAESLEFIHEITGVIDGKKASQRPGIEEIPDQNYWYLFPMK